MSSRKFPSKEILGSSRPTKDFYLLIFKKWKAASLLNLINEKQKKDILIISNWFLQVIQSFYNIFQRYFWDELLKSIMKKRQHRSTVLRPFKVPPFRLEFTSFPFRPSPPDTEFIVCLPWEIQYTDHLIPIYWITVQSYCTHSIWWTRGVLTHSRWCWQYCRQ